MVDVSNKQNSITITVGSSNRNNSVTTKSDTAQYWSNLSRDYSEQAKTSAYKAEQVKNEIITQKDSIIADIENTGVNAVDSIATIKSESIADIEAKINEASELVDAGIENINTVKNETIDEINNTKTDIITDIEFVADGEKQEIEELIDTGRIEEKLVNKADTNASNFTTEGKSLISGLAMPSSKSIDFAWGASGAEYTAPANGYFNAGGYLNSGGHMAVWNKTSNIADKRVSTVNGFLTNAYIPAKKGDVVQLQYGNYTGSGHVTFIYAEGEGG